MALAKRDAAAARTTTANDRMDISAFERSPEVGATRAAGFRLTGIHDC
jgi:hypothetical protein